MHPYFQNRDKFLQDILAGINPQQPAAPAGLEQAPEQVAEGAGDALEPLAQSQALPAGTAGDLMSQVTGDEAMKRLRSNG